MSFEMKGNRLFVDGRKIGWMTKLANGKKVFVSPRKQKHKMRIFDAWGLSKEVLDFLKTNSFDEIHIRLSRDITLMSHLSDWYLHGIEGKYQDFENQVFLPEKYFRSKQTTLAEIMETAR